MSSDRREKERASETGPTEMGLDSRISELAGEMGADFFGVADLSLAREAILIQGGLAVAGFPRAISIGIALPHAIVDQLPQRADRTVAMNYEYRGRDVINQRLDHMASRLSSLLQRKGYGVLPVPARQVVDGERLCGVFSHKMAAHLAGLGWIGKSCLLITPEVGPRVRWATVLTDAPLQVTGGPMAERCGACQQCVDICPPGAFTGRSFRVEEPREARFAAHKCRAYRSEWRESTGSSVCGLCLYICPYGRGNGRRNGLDTKREQL